MPVSGRRPNCRDFSASVLMHRCTEGAIAALAKLAGALSIKAYPLPNSKSQLTKQAAYGFAPIVTRSLGRLTSGSAITMAIKPQTSTIT